MKNAIAPGGTIGIIGGGQLGRMTALAASNMGYKTHIYTPDSDSPAAQVSHYVTCAPYDDNAALEKFAKSVDVMSYEFENIPYKTLLFLEKIGVVRPGWKALHVSQNRLREKSMFTELGVPTNKYVQITNEQQLVAGFKSLGSGKCILKTAELGYDAKGQAVIEQESDLLPAWEKINQHEAILEQYVKFDKEISVILARGMDTSYKIFPVGENKHVKGILDTCIIPAEISNKVIEKAKKYTVKIAEHLKYVGILAVEFFVTNDGEVLANEIAPRTHNSGHWTQDGCITSQFEQFVRAICGLPLGDVAQHSRTEMKNLIGDDIDNWKEILQDPSAKLHLYGKSESRPGRKMGHVNYIRYSIF